MCALDPGAVPVVSAVILLLAGAAAAPVGSRGDGTPGLLWYPYGLIQTGSGDLQDQVTKAWTVKHYGTILSDPEAGDSLHAKNVVIVCLLETR